jgi:uncharacterized protein YcbK (DUF882 family)
MLDRNEHLSETLASPNEAALSHSNKFDGLHLSPHFVLGEFTKTNFKTEDNNEPPLEAVENMIDLCNDWLEVLRRGYNRRYVLASDEDYNTSNEVEPLVINQGFRSYQVMLAMEKAGLNPSRTSNHMTGCAADIRCAGVEEALRKMVILLDIADEQKMTFDELFLERRGSIYWIHFAARAENNRGKISFIIN